MNRDKAGGNAFPNEDYYGMTLRDYFAANALQGLLAPFGQQDINSFEELASDAYLAADAMIKQREKQ